MPEPAETASACWNGGFLRVLWRAFGLRALGPGTTPSSQDQSAGTGHDFYGGSCMRGLALVLTLAAAATFESSCTKPSRAASVSTPEELAAARAAGAQWEKRERSEIQEPATHAEVECLDWNLVRSAAFETLSDAVGDPTPDVREARTISVDLVRVDSLGRIEEGMASGTVELPESPNRVTARFAEGSEVVLLLEPPP